MNKLLKKSNTKILYVAFLLAITLFFSEKSFSQINPNNNLGNSQKNSKFFYGGNFGFQIGDYTSIYVAPIVGYKIFPKLGVGISPSYHFYKYKGGVEGNHTSHTIGAGVFTRYIVIPNLFLHLEYDKHFIKLKNTFIEDENYTSENLFFGAGYQTRIIGNVYLTGTVLWNLLNLNSNTIANPTVRMGVSYGF